MLMESLLMESLLMESLSWPKTLVLFVLQTRLCSTLHVMPSCLTSAALMMKSYQTPCLQCHTDTFSVLLLQEASYCMEQGKAVIGSYRRVVGCLFRERLACLCFDGSFNSGTSNTSNRAALGRRVWWEPADVCETRRRLCHASGCSGASGVC